MIMLRELFDDEEWNFLKRQNEELFEKAGSLPDEIPLYNIQPVSVPDAEKDYYNQQKDHG